VCISLFAGIARIEVNFIVGKRLPQFTLNLMGIGDVLNWTISNTMIPLYRIMYTTSDCPAKIRKKK
jgi:hypothetical protein